MQLIGTDVLQDLDKTLKKADLGWHVIEDVVTGKNSGAEMRHKKMLLRSDTKEALGVVGANYEPVTPEYFAQQQYRLAEQIGGEVTRMGFVKERARAFAFIRLKDIQIPIEHRKKDDVVGSYVYSTDGWDGKTPSKSRLYLERLACANGMTSREITASMWVSHTRRREERVEDRQQTFLGEIESQLSAIKDRYIELAQLRMGPDEMKSFLSKLFPKNSKKSEQKREQIMHLFGSGTANDGKTAYDALNAVTEYVTHYRTFRDTHVRSGTTNRFVGVLEKDTLKERALQLLEQKWN